MAGPLRATHGPLAAWLCAATLLTSCGYVGDPQPPALNIPQPPSEVAVTQQAGTLRVAFTVAPATTEGLPLQLDRAEVRVGETVQPVVAPAVGRAEATVDAGPHVGQQVAVSVRLVHRRGRPSDWSPAVDVLVLAPPPTPRGVAAEATVAGIRLTWRGPANTRYRVYRTEPTPKEPALLATVDAPTYTDAAAEFGRPYAYTVEAVQASGANEASSALSTPLTYTAEDRFPPAPPSGLGAIAGVTTVELTWVPNSEADFAGYRVYRSEGEGAPERLAEGLLTPAYSDAGVQAGKRYRYSVSAVDRRGNESGRSEAAEATLP